MLLRGSHISTLRPLDRKRSQDDPGVRNTTTAALVHPLQGVQFL